MTSRYPSASPNSFASFAATRCRWPTDLAVGLGQVVGRRDHLLRDDEDVDRGLRVDVVERQAAVVLVGDLRRDLLVEDLQEDVVGEHRPLHTNGYRPQFSGRPGGCPRSERMPWRVGLDEAGYGPNLGPLVLSSSACHVPADAPACLWECLAAAVRKAEHPDDGRLLIDDSKKVNEGKAGLARLEAGVLGALAQTPRAARHRPRLPVHGRPRATRSTTCTPNRGSNPADPLPAAHPAGRPADGRVGAGRRVRAGRGGLGAGPVGGHPGPEVQPAARRVEGQVGRPGHAG